MNYIKYNRARYQRLLMKLQRAKRRRSRANGGMADWWADRWADLFAEMNLREAIVKSAIEEYERGRK